MCVCAPVCVHVCVHEYDFIIVLLKEFLAKLSPPLSLNDDEIVRWHPGFMLDDVAEVKEAPLPQPPTYQICSTAQDVLNFAQSSFISPRMQEALENVATFSKAVKSEQQVNETAPSNPALDKALKGVSQSLLDKVKHIIKTPALNSCTFIRSSRKRHTMLKLQ